MSTHTYVAETGLPVAIAIGDSNVLRFTFAIVLLASITALWNRYAYGLHRFPGPFWASMTYLWRLHDAYRHGNQRPTFVKLHEVHGDIVRLGPRTLSFASPQAVKDIYGPLSNFQKSRWYLAFEAHGKGERKENIFSTRDIHWHAEYRGAVSPGFKLSHLGQKEASIDDLMSSLLELLDHESDKNDVEAGIDLPLFLQYFAFDAGGVFSFSKPYGFLNKKLDIDGIIKSVRSGSTHLNRLAQVPIFQTLLDKNPLARYFGFIAPPMAFTLKYLPKDRITEQLNQPEKHDHNHDILDQFLNAHKDHPGVVSERETVDLGLMVVVPASEAVRTAMSVLVFQMLKNPLALQKLQNELDSIVSDRGRIPSWKVVSTQLPYLDACIKETFRIHPSTGFMLERVVPLGGAMISGEFIAAGTVVGCIPWVIHRHKPTFGEDVELFKPERWLDASDVKKKEMDRMLCPFGLGTRLCLGRDIGLFEVFKMGATLFSNYTISLVQPDDDMKITWGNIVSVDFKVHLKRRAPMKRTA